MRRPLGIRTLRNTTPLTAPAAAPTTYDPSVLDLNLWLRGSYGGSPWVGTASAGNSSTWRGAHANAPGVGAAVNGYTPADFDGTNDTLTVANTVPNNATLADIISAPAWTMVFLINMDAADADAGAGNRFTQPNLIADSGAYFVVSYTSSGVAIEMADGITTTTIAVACATGGWHMVKIRYDGTKYYLGVDSGAMTEEAGVGNVANTTGNVYIGSNYDRTAFVNGKIMEVMGADTDLGNTVLTSIKSYFNSRYNL